MVPRAVVSLLAVLAAGCGSAGRDELPPAAGPAASPPLAAEPAGRIVPVGFEPGDVVPSRHVRPGGAVPLDRGRQVAVVSPRERVVETFDAATRERTGRANAGVGPTHAASDNGNYLFVTDTAGGALLVYHLRPRLELIRRYPLPGSPYGIAIDNVRHRMYVTQTALNRLTELTVGGRPSLVARYATPRQPNTVAVDETTGRVAVAGKADGVLQLLDPDRERIR
jgi:DNA-binding beta-propeller fold protein YncE